MPALFRRLLIGTSWKSLRARWVLAAAAPLLGVLWLSGCENTFEYARYPKDLVYPLRTDPIVTEKPTSEVFAPPEPGRLDEEIAQIPKLGGKTIDPTDAANFPDPNDPKKPSPALRDKQRDLLQTALNKVFGTPREPRVGAASEDPATVVQPLVQLKVRDAAADAPFKTLAQGSKVFRYHCVHCHGLTGDGRGPTGPWVVPHPRDYRSGEFKFISTNPDLGNKKPRREDLLRTLRNGIENTSMPSFALLDVRDPESKDKETDLEAVVSYVIHLSIRGQVEQDLLKEMALGARYANQDEADQGVHSKMVEVVSQWDASNQQDGSLMTPAKGSYSENMSSGDSADSIRRGYALFTDPKGDASCIKCHTDFGRQANFRYDVWGTLVRPMNLTSGVYRGGRRPIDLFWRIKGGVQPSTMPKTGMNNDKDIWDVVNFVHALPYPQMLPEDVRKKVYDAPPDEGGKAERAEK